MDIRYHQLRNRIAKLEQNQRTVDFAAAQQRFRAHGTWPRSEAACVLLLRIEGALATARLSDWGENGANELEAEAERAPHRLMLQLIDLAAGDVDSADRQQARRALGELVVARHRARAEGDE